MEADGSRWKLEGANGSTWKIVTAKDFGGS